MPGKVLDGPITIRGDLVVTGHINKGQDTAQSNNGSSLQVIQGVLQAVVTQPNTVPASGDVRMYGQNVTINSNVVPGGTDGYFQIDQYINGAWQHLFEIMPSTTGNANVLDLFISGRVFARDSLLSAPGRTWGSLISNPFGGSYISSIAYGNGVFVAGTTDGKIARSTDGGATWGSLISNPFGSSIIASIAYGNGVFVAGTADGKIARSLDGGVTWGIKYGDSSTVTVLNTIIHAIATNGAGRFVIVGYDSSNISIAYTDYVEAGAGIVESGSNSNGSWIKFADGTMECWYVSSNLLTTNGGSAPPIYYNNASFTFPILIVGNLPVVTPMRQGGANAFSWGAENNGLPSLSGTAIYYCSIEPNTTLYPGYRAIGRWK